MFGLGTDTFEGFDAADFDAYEERKWSSNRFNLERMRASGRLTALREAAFPNDQVDLRGLEARATESHPTVFNHKQVDAQWVSLLRAQDERRRLAILIDREHPLQRLISDPAPHHAHAVLALRLHHAGLDVLLGIHRFAWLDARNAFHKWEDADERTRFMELIHALPETLRVGLIDELMVPNEWCEEHLSSLAQSLSPDGDSEWFQIVRFIERGDSCLTEAGLIEGVADTLEQLWPIYKHLAWSQDNDFLHVVEQLDEEREARRTAAGTIEPGQKIQVVGGGMFSGRTGLVLELDGKGNAKILLGSLPVRVRIQELQAIQ